MTQISQALKKGEVVPTAHSLGVLKENVMGRESLTGAFMKPEPLSFIDAKREMGLPGQAKNPKDIVEDTLKYL